MGVAFGVMGTFLAQIMIVLGIVLHVVATARRRRVDRDLPIPATLPLLRNRHLHRPNPSVSAIAAAYPRSASIESSHCGAAETRPAGTSPEMEP